MSRYFNVNGNDIDLVVDKYLLINGVGYRVGDIVVVEEDYNGHYKERREGRIIDMIPNSPSNIHCKIILDCSSQYETKVVEVVSSKIKSIKKIEC